VLWTRKRASEGRPDGGATPDRAAPRDVAEAGGHELDAIDTVASILRTLGRHSIDLAGAGALDFGRRCEAWAQHLAVGAPHPAAHDDADRSPARRDWAGARRFVLQRRKDEVAAVATTVSGLRDVIWQLTERVASALIRDQGGNAAAVRQVERLRRAAGLDSIELMRHEVEAVADALSELLSERERRIREQIADLGAQVSALREELQEVKQESALDALTRLFNRGAVERALARAHQLGAIFGHDVCLIVADIDHFKGINDRYGHPGGDAALRAFADCLVRGFPRRSDFIGRYGGDEFVVLLPETTADQAARLADRFLQSVRALAIEHHGATISLTSSLGIGELEPGETAEAWLARVDAALYRAKQQGRDRAVAA
jgi:diguanylate cyclase